MDPCGDCNYRRSFEGFKLLVSQQVEAKITDEYNNMYSSVKCSKCCKTSDNDNFNDYVYIYCNQY